MPPTDTSATLASLIDSAKAAERTGSWDEALACYEGALRSLGGQGDAQQAADLLRWIGTVRRERGDLELALDAYETSLAIAKANGNAGQVASALNCLAVAEQHRGRLDRAHELYAEAGVLADQAGDRRLAVMIDQNLGALANTRGQVADALQSYRSALDRCRLLGEDLITAHTLNNMGMAHVDLEEWTEAEQCLESALRLAESAGDLLMQGTVELNRAELFLQRQRFEQAREHCARSLEIFERLRSKPGIGESYRFLGMLHRDTGQVEQANAHFALALGLAEASQDRLLQGESKLEWARMLLEVGRAEEGIRYLNGALALFTELQASREVLDIQRRFTRAEDLYVGAVVEWSAGLLGEHDPAAAEHAARVAERAVALGRRQGLAGWELTTIRVGALLHEIGDTAVPAEFRCASDGLPQCVRSVRQVYAITGDALVRHLAFPLAVSEIVRGHHEHWAGTGQPDRLLGEAIPRGARIVAIADAYDGLTRSCPFRPGVAPEAALQQMEQDAGTIFDPGMLRDFREMILAEQGVHACAA